MTKSKTGPSQFAFLRTEKVRAVLAQAMKQIFEEIKSNDGIYPHNGGALPQAELCRRAGVSQATLQNPTHKYATRVEVNKWLEEMHELIVTGQKAVRSTVTKRADYWKSEYLLVATHYNISRLEVADLNEKLAGSIEENALRRSRIAELEAENALLRSDLSNGKVVRFPSDNFGP